MDMRMKIRFPRPPSSKEEVFDAGIPAWHLACALVGNYSSWQYNTYRKYWILLGDTRFRDILDTTRIILSESKKIESPPRFLTAQLACALLVSSVS